MPSLIRNNSDELMLLWGVVGLSPVVFLIFIELFVLNSLCVLCTLDHVLIVSAFIFAVEKIRKEK